MDDIMARIKQIDDPEVLERVAVRLLDHMQDPLNQALTRGRQAQAMDREGRSDESL